MINAEKHTTFIKSLFWDRFTCAVFNIFGNLAGRQFFALWYKAEVISGPRTAVCEPKRALMLGYMCICILLYQFLGTSFVKVCLVPCVLVCDCGSYSCRAISTKSQASTHVQILFSSQELPGAGGYRFSLSNLAMYRDCVQGLIPTCTNMSWSVFLGPNDSSL